VQPDPLPSGATPTSSTPRGRAGFGWRTCLLLATAVAAAAYACSQPRLPQPLDYLDFADERALLGVPNALNVLSNAAFAVVGLAGLGLLPRGRIAFRDGRERWPWLVFFAGVALTSFGSAWFHLRPSIDSLVWDRIPMAVGFMGLFTALIAERIDPAAGARLLWPAVAAGVASVVYWWLSEQGGAGDLRPYFLVQFYPLTALPLLLVLFPGAYTGTSAYVVALLAYALAKLAEVADARIFALGGIVSGHTLKHLLAAAGIGALVQMLARRRALPDSVRR
jgi:hypothetical protein